MKRLRPLLWWFAVFLAALPTIAGAQDRVARKEVVVALAVEPWSMLAATIVDWNPRADEKVWMYDAKVTPR